MRTKIRRLRSMLLTLGLLTPMLFVVQTVVGPAMAEARCAGVNHQVTSTLNLNGSVIVAETPLTGTCNNNGLYQGYFQSGVSGWRASVWIQNGGVWQGYGGNYDTQVYSYSFNDSNSYSYISLCLDDGANHWYCGWGNLVTSGLTHTYYGVDSGF